MASDDKKILLVEDEKAIRDAVAAYLERENYLVRGVGDGQSAVEEFEKHSFDLVILDLMLPKLSGERVCRAIRETSNVPIIMLTAKGEVEDRIIGLELGADDYIVKPFDAKEVTARIKAVLRRSAKDSQSEKGREETLKIGGLRLDFSSYQAWLHDEPIALTPKEYELLKLLVTNPGRAFTRDELLERIWGYEYYGDTRTVDVHIRHLRAKLKGDENISKAIETVRGIGYRFARRTA